jgi:FKBP-type peptidyl-prolyl cis-trans isomerase FkpA
VIKHSTLALGLALAAAACAGDDAPEPAADAAAEAPAAESGAPAFAPALEVDLSKMTQSATGLYVQDIREGQGEPLAAGQTAVVHYTGWLPDGTKFDSSRDRNEPFEVAVGQGQVIPGWEEGLQGMKAGGHRKLVIPPTLAYGAEGAGGGVIPPNATLVFDVELLEVK